MNWELFMRWYLTVFSIYGTICTIRTVVTKTFGLTDNLLELFAFDFIMLVFLLLVFWKIRMRFLADNLFDYKLFFDTLPDWLFTGPKSIPGLKDDLCNGRKIIPRWDITESSALDLLTARELRCRAVRNSDKIRKHILQCSFVPLDRDGNTLCIRRLRAFHPSFFRLMKDTFLKRYSCISFSPIPNRFGDSFTPLATYHREVPESGIEPSLKYIGTLLRKIRPEKGCKEPVIDYFFFVYAAYYPDVSFTKNGRPDWSTIDKLFCSAPARHRWMGKKKYFKKDNDRIDDTMSIETLATKILNNDPEAVRHWLPVERELLPEVAKWFTKESAARGTD